MEDNPMQTRDNDYNDDYDFDNINNNTHVKVNNTNLAAHLTRHQEIIPTEWRSFCIAHAWTEGENQNYVLWSDYKGYEKWLNINHSSRALGAD